MIKKTIAMISLLLLCSFVAQAQDASQFNGVYWNQLTQDGKAVFIVGMANGEYIALKLLYDWEENIILDLMQERLEDLRTISDVIAKIDTFYTENPEKWNYPVALVYLMSIKQGK